MWTKSAKAWRAWARPSEASMSDANDTANILQRLESLEIKASFTEDLLDQLNMTIYQQQQLIDRLTHEVIQLRQQAPEGGSNGSRNLRDELPPHY